MVAAEMRSTASNGSSSTWSLGRWIRATARPIVVQRFRPGEALGEGQPVGQHADERLGLRWPGPHVDAEDLGAAGVRSQQTPRSSR